MRNLGIGVLILFGMICGACGGENKPVAVGGSLEASASSNSSAPTSVEVYEVKEYSAPVEELIPATITVEGTAQVLAQRDGIVTLLAIEEGAPVTKGQVVAQLNDDDLRAALRQAELEVERLQVEERQYEAMIRVNRSELDQEAALFKDGLTSKRQLDRAQFKLDVATQELQKTRLATRVAQAKVDAARVEVEKAVIRAPISGVIGRRYAHLGANVVKNDKLFEISQSGPFEVKFQLPQSDKGRLGPGTTVSISLVDSDQIVARARIRRVDPVADAASNTVGFLADVIGRTSLIPGLAVNVHVPRGGAASTVWVPRAAFPTEAEVRSGSASTLFLVQNGQCVARAVRVKSVEGSQVETSSGLNAGDRVILAPPAGLKAGNLVEARK